MTWDESEHPRDEIGRFTFKNGGEEEGKEKQEEGKTKKENDNKPKKEKNKQNDFSNIEPFKLGAQYNDVRIESPKEILYGANSKTSKDISIKNERNKLINKLGNKLTPAQVLYSNVDDLRRIEQNAIQKQTLNLEQNKANSKINNNFKYDFKKHDELKQLLKSHHDAKGNTPLPKGYELLEKYHSNKTGLDVEIYEYENEIILSFPGSEQLKKDYIDTDYRNMFKNNKNPQLEEAQNIFQKIKNNPEFKNKKIIVTGYSLGGNIAGGLSVLNNIEGVTFNPYGNLDKILQQKADDLGQEIEINPEKLINYRHEGDRLSKNTKVKNPGLQYEIPKLSENLEKNDILNHFIKNIGDSITRYPEGNFSDKTIYYPKLSDRIK